VKQCLDGVDGKKQRSTDLALWPTPKHPQDRHLAIGQLTEEEAPACSGADGSTADSHFGFVQHLVHERHGWLLVHDLAGPEQC